MKSFISETISDILKTTTSFKNTVFILPSQRAGVFIKKALKEQFSGGFLPQIVTIEEFTSTLSGIKKIDTIPLLYHFYGIYKNLEKKPISFDEFASWAFTVLQDFNEIDQHLVDAKAIFVYLRDIHRLKKWTLEGEEISKTKLITDHFSFLEKLEHYYKEYYSFLVEKKIGYQGILYREAVKNIDSYLQQNKEINHFFIGFNALNKAEEELFQKIILEGSGTVYWDIDKTFLENNSLAGKFISQYFNTWKYYKKNKLKFVGNHFNSNKHIEIIGAAKNISQIKYAAEILEKLPNHNNTALVLVDESLLPVTLNSLPNNITSLNITMGYVLKNIPTTHFFSSIFQLFITQEKLQQTKKNRFYFKDVIRFLKQIGISSVFTKQVNTLTQQINTQNTTFVSQLTIEAVIEERAITQIFSPYQSISHFMKRILVLIEFLKNKTEGLEKEYLFRFYTIFMQLDYLHKEYKYIQNLKTLYQFFKQLIASETLSFKGEPLQGLQVMGMLETRVLDFETLILTSANEGVLPANNTPSSFIPFDVKWHFNLPTYKEKDAIFSYHFFRLMQRAKNIFIIYNTEQNRFGSGEKSRFVTQLQMLKNKCIEKTVSPEVITLPNTVKRIAKSENTLNRLEEIATKGISPSALTNYLYNPIAFYKQKILNIKPFEEVEETIAFNTMGTVVHQVLNQLYSPFTGQFITSKIISEIQKEVAQATENHFKIWFKKGNIKTGKNKLIFEVAKQYVHNFLEQEKKLVESNQLKIIATEKKYSFTLPIEGLSFPIKLHGEIDRVDELNGVTRIIDYKTGLVKESDLKITDFQQITDFKYAKAIQVLLYSFLYTKVRKENSNSSIEAGIYSFKNLKKGFLKLNFSSNYRNPDYAVTEERLTEFITQLKQLIKEIYTKETDFIAPLNLPF